MKDERLSDIDADLKELENRILSARARLKGAKAIAKEAIYRAKLASGWCYDPFAAEGMPEEPIATEETLEGLEGDVDAAQTDLFAQGGERLS